MFLMFNSAASDSSSAFIRVTLTTEHEYGDDDIRQEIINPTINLPTDVREPAYSNSSIITSFGNVR